MPPPPERHRCLHLSRRCHRRHRLHRRRRLHSRRRNRRHLHRRLLHHRPPHRLHPLSRHQPEAGGGDILRDEPPQPEVASNTTTLSNNARPCATSIAATKYSANATAEAATNATTTVNGTTQSGGEAPPIKVAAVAFATEPLRPLSDAPGVLVTDVLAGPVAAARGLFEGQRA